MKLHLGVTDIPYSSAMASQASRTERWKAGKRPWQNLAGTQTTGDVAEILEARYGVMETFYDMNEETIGEQLVEVMQGKLETLIMGGPASTGPLFNEGDLGGIEQMFRDALDKRAFDGRIEGVPTGASLRGVNHRLSQPNVRRGSRPSFIDTGLYQANFRAWVEE